MGEWMRAALRRAIGLARLQLELEATKARLKLVEEDMRIVRAVLARAETRTFPPPRIIRPGNDDGAAS